MGFTYEFEEGVVDFQIPYFVKALKQENEFGIDLGSGRYFYGYATLPVMDTEGDKIELKAIEEGAKNLTNPPYNKIFLGHQYSDIAVGKIVDKKITNKGLIILAKLNEDHERADEVWKSINEGYLDGFSVGGSFIRVETEYDSNLKRNVNVVKKVIFREVSLTSIPAHQDALLVGAFVKSKKIINDFQNEKSETFKYNVSVVKSMEEGTQNNSNEAVVETASDNTLQTSEKVETTENKETVETKEEPTEKAEEPTKTETSEADAEAKEETEEVKDPQKSQTPLLDALRKQVEELTQKTLDLEKKLKEKENTEDEEETSEEDEEKKLKKVADEEEEEKEEEEEEKKTKSLRQSVPTNSSKFQQDTYKVKTPLLDFLKRA